MQTQNRLLKLAIAFSISMLVLLLIFVVLSRAATDRRMQIMAGSNSNVKFMTWNSNPRLLPMGRLFDSLCSPNHPNSPEIIFELCDFDSVDFEGKYVSRAAELGVRCTKHARHQ